MVTGSDRTSELRLPTKTVAVRLAVLGAAPAAAEMFVADVPGRGHGQLLDDLAAQLGAAAGFVPVRWAHQVRLLGKHTISWVAVHRSDHDDAPVADAAGEPPEELTLYDRQHLVEVELMHTGKLVGTLLDSFPADRPRVIDHLNRAGPFLRLWTSTEHYLINTSQVITVTEVAESTEAT